MTNLMPYRRPAPAPPDPATLADYVTDLRCTHCAKSITAVSLLEVAWTKPCPLCRQCDECRDLCLSGGITHGMEAS